MRNEYSRLGSDFFIKIRRSPNQSENLWGPCSDFPLRLRARRDPGHPLTGGKTIGDERINGFVSALHPLTITSFTKAGTHSP